MPTLGWVFINCVYRTRPQSWCESQGLTSRRKSVLSGQEISWSTQLKRKSHSTGNVNFYFDKYKFSKLKTNPQVLSSLLLPLFSFKKGINWSLQEKQWARSQIKDPSCFHFNKQSLMRSSLLFAVVLWKWSTDEQDWKLMCGGLLIPLMPAQVYTHKSNILVCREYNLFIFVSWQFIAWYIKQGINEYLFSFQYWLTSESTNPSLTENLGESSGCAVFVRCSICGRGVVQLV